MNRGILATIYVRLADRRRAPRTCRPRSSGATRERALRPRAAVQEPAGDPPRARHQSLPDRGPSRPRAGPRDPAQRHRQPGQGRLRPGAAEHERDARPARDRWASARRRCFPEAGARMAIGLAEIEAAAGVLAGQVVRTPCLRSARLSEVLGAEITLKLETLQHSSSFKDRGALVKLASLTAAERRRGRDRDVGRQPRPGRRLPRDPPRHPGDDRDAAADAVREGREDRAVRRQGRARGRDRRRGRGLRAASSRPSATWSSSTPTTTRRSSPARARSASRCWRTCPRLEVLVVPIGGGGLIAGVATAAKALQARRSRSSASRPPPAPRCTAGAPACPRRRCGRASPRASRSSARAG